MIINPLRGIPLIKPGDDLANIIYGSVLSNDLIIEDNDIFVIAQKIVSKSENRLINLNDVSASQAAIDLAKKTEKDERLVELILRESKKVIRYRPGAVIVEHRLGFICANAGIDHSNVEGLYGDADDWVLLLPEDPDKSAEVIGKGLESLSKKRIGVLIIDSHGRAWRLGVAGLTIGLYHVQALVDMRGVEDIFGFKLRITQVALASACSLVMGQAAERIPAVLVKGFPYELAEGHLRDLIRPEDQDLFR
jgi:coenzyme F420-0:L-glutamate ligase/coenzyme F420-1:gamma-L-glutamate ligase